MIETEFGVLMENNSVINRIEMLNVCVLGMMCMSEVRKLTLHFLYFMASDVLWSFFFSVGNDNYIIFITFVP